MQPIKSTTSVCSSCLSKVPAQVFEENGQVLLEKTCPEHGNERALLASDQSAYYRSAAKGDDCGTGGCCMLSHSCTMMFEITEYCNLTCPTCFADSSPQKAWHMPLEEFESKLDRLLEQGKGDADVVQLSGGEPTMHPQIEAILAMCFNKGIESVYINSNGIRFAKDDAFVQEVSQYKGRVNVYLQMDGFEESTYVHIRGAKGLASVKERAINNLLERGIYVVPVMTVTPGINDHEVGQVIRYALDRHPKMKMVMLQPAMYAGRYEPDQLFGRLTVGDVTKLIEDQTAGLLTQNDFGPIPCSDPNCFSMAVGVKQSGQDMIPVSRYFPPFESWANPAVAGRIDRFRDKLPHNMIDALGDDDAIVDQLLDMLSGASEEPLHLDRTDQFFVVAIKPFMDVHTYDQDRVDQCCVHVIDRGGEPVSLCEYNVLRRPQGLL